MSEFWNTVHEPVVALVEDMRERYLEGVLHLGPVNDGLGTLPHEPDNRRDGEARNGRHRAQVADHIDALGHTQPRRVGVDDEGGDALGARRLAGAREHDILVGETGVGDPRLRAVQHIAVVAGRRRRHAHVGDVGAAFGLGNRKRRDAPSRRDVG